MSCEVCLFEPRQGQRITRSYILLPVWGHTFYYYFLNFYIQLEVKVSSCYDLHATADVRHKPRFTDLPSPANSDRSLARSYELRRGPRKCSIQRATRLILRRKITLFPGLLCIGNLPSDADPVACFLQKFPQFLISR